MGKRKEKKWCQGRNTHVLRTPSRVAFSSYVGDDIHHPPAMAPLQGRGVNTMRGSIFDIMNHLGFGEEATGHRCWTQAESGCLRTWGAWSCVSRAKGLHMTADTDRIYHVPALLLSRTKGM